MDLESSLGLPSSVAASVLLVDDHPPNLLALEGVLEPLGLELVRAGSGDEALEHVLRRDFAAILLDVQMPKMDGFQTAANIRRQERGWDVPIIFVTATSYEYLDVSQGYAHGAIDYLAKPLDPVVLRAKVTALVDLWRRGELLRRRETRIHERENATLRSAVRQSEAQLRLIIDGVRDHAISMLDSDGRVQTLNAPGQRIKGYPLSEVRGRHFRMFFTEADQATGLPEQELEIARSVGRYDGEGWRRRKDGTQFYAAVSLSALRDDQGELVGFVKVTQDITERRKLSQTLHRRETEQRLIIDAIPGLVAYVNADLTYGFVNRTYQEWFGVPPESVVGRPLIDVLGQEAFQALKGHVEAALAGQRVSFDAAIPYGQGTRWVRAEYVPDISADGSVPGYFSLVLDVTDSKRTAEQMVEEARVNETLYRIGTSLAENLDLDVIVQRLTDEATTLCRAQFGAFFYNVVEPQGGSYMLYALAGVPRETFAQFPMPRNTAVFGETFSGRGVVRSDDITRDPRYGQSAPYHGMPKGHLPVRGYLAVPVVLSTGEVLGGLFFGHAEVGVFSERDERMLVAVAAQAAVAIDNARLHAATAAAEEKYRALAESSPQFVWTTSADGVIEYCNRQFIEFVGLTVEEMRSETKWENIVHPDDVPRAAASWQQALRESAPYELEYRFRHAADGSYRWFLTRGVPVFDSDGGILRWVGSSTDIDERKRTEENQRLVVEAGALLASSLDYRSTLTSLVRLAAPHMADWCAVHLIDDHGLLEPLAIWHENPEKVALAQEVGRRYTSLQEDARLRVLTTGTSELIAEVTEEVLAAVARDSTHRDLMRELGLRSWMAAPIIAHRRCLGVISFASAESGRRFGAADLAVADELGRRSGLAIDNARLFELARSDRQRAEEANRAKDLFLSSLSHELRTPLNAVLGWTRMLRTGTLPEEKRNRALESIDRNARAQVALIEDILDLSRITSGKMRLTVTPVDVVHVVDTALDTVRPGAEAKGVRIQTVLDPDAGILHGDAARLQQIFWNILSNAVKFTPKGGRVYVRLERSQSQIELVVSDTGQGIEPEFLPRVFERFMQADATSTRQHGGLGLGLAIAKHLVELHGGTIRAESDGPGQGATFVIRLPVAPVRATPQPIPVVVNPRAEVDIDCPPELAGLRVLIVDDDPDARELIQSLLESCQARVVAAATAAEAFAHFAGEPPDVLVSDVGMAGEDGYSLIRRIRALPPERGGRVPAVAVTAYASIKDRTRALIEGFTSHVTKPTEPQELLAVVSALAGRHRRP